MMETKCAGDNFFDFVDSILFIFKPTLLLKIYLEFLSRDENSEFTS